METTVERSSIESLLSLAATQHQLVSLVQADGLGVPRTAVRYACDRGWLRTVRRGVVAVAGAKPSAWEPLMAAALAAGPDAVISHMAAANIHRFSGIAPSGPELTLPRTRGVVLSGVRIHRSHRLDPVDFEQRSGVRLTTPIRTVIDISGVTGDYLLGRILDSGAIRWLWTPEAIAARLNDLGGAGVPGPSRLRRLLEVRKGEGHQDSELEMRVMRVLRSVADKVPQPVTHHQVVFGESVIDMDLAWPELLIDGEIDGREAHIQRLDFDRDRLRANVLLAHGWRMVHWVSTMDDDAIVAQLRPYFGRL
jgi:hypothetical protein